MVKSGLQYSYGLGFWGPNGHDGVWHLSLISGLSKGSLQMPIFAGEMIKNYHIGFDLLLAILHFITFIPVSWLYFQILPPLLAAGIGWAVYKFMIVWLKDRVAAYWGLFFVYFGGSWGWLVSFLRNHTTGGESMFWAQQSISTLLNPPFALSVLMLFLGLICLLNYSSRPSRKLFLITVLLFGLLIEIKVYAGILGLGALLITSVRDNKLLKIFLGSLFVSLVIFLPLNHGSQNLVVYKPGWFLQTMLIYSDRFYWPRLYRAITDTRAVSDWPKFVFSYLVALFIFVAGNLGTRVIALFSVQRKDMSDISPVFIYSLILLGLFFPLLFIQQGTPWNTIQFFYYSLIFCGILAGRSVSVLLRSSKLKKYSVFIISLPVFLLTIPTTLDTLRHYLPNRPPAMISTDELQALNVLARLPDGVVFTVPIQPDAGYPPPRPLYLYDSTAYVSAYGGHPVFLEDTVNLNITGYNWPEREIQSLTFVSQKEPQAAMEFIKSNNIRYIYLPLVAKYRPFLSATQIGGQVIFENSQAAIWKIY